MRQRRYPLAVLTAVSLAAIAVAACGSGDDDNNAPTEVRMTWFGVTNWHYQVGDLGIMLDGAVGYPARDPNPAMVTKVHDALKLKGDVDIVLLGHLHGDHSVDTPEWAKQTKAQFTAKTPDKTLTWYVTDSGAGGRDLTIDQVDTDGVNRGAPLTNLSNAVRDSGVDGFEVWQGGPESRVVNQARTVVPAFNVKYFMPHHFGARGGFDILNGLHYPYVEEEMPKLKELLAKANVPQFYSKNFFDAFVYDKDGIRAVANAEVKLAMGLPASGIGPGVQGTNPRTGEMECEED